MGLRTSSQYIEGLRDNREVYMNGERVPDVTKHPVLRRALEHLTVEFDITSNPQYRDLAVTESEDGGLMHRHFKIPRNGDDLIKRHDLVDLQCKLANGIIATSKAIGGDALHALITATHEIDQKMGTKYLPRVLEYYRHVRKNDLTLAGCVTDVKGDRALRPSQQAHPDYYLRIVEKRKDGIVVRGAKIHVSCAAYVDELVVVPTRFMPETDKDYAVAFAIPCNAKGLKFICRPEPVRDPIDFPLSSKAPLIESMVIFDDVFVPWDRVFLCGEWQVSALAANWFGNWHRFTGVSYKGPMADLLLGCACLAAEYNGVADYPHIKDSIMEVASYAGTIRAFARAAASEPLMVEPGMACPNPLYTNLGKHYFAATFGRITERVMDIAGGIAGTGPCWGDVQNPATRGYILKYLDAKAGYSAEHRLKLMKLVSDLAASGMGGYLPMANMHGEGSLAAQKLAIFRTIDKEEYVKFAKRVANID